MQTKISLKLDSDLLKHIRLLAAEDGKSLSALLSQKMRELLVHRKDHEHAKKRALARLQAGLDLGWSPAISREKLHER